MNKKFKNSLFFKIIILIFSILLIFSSIIVTQASESNEQETKPVILTPNENQYFELKATTINNVEGKGKQLIMELWGHEIYFKRI